MANVKDLLVNGSARVIGTIYGNATSATDSDKLDGKHLSEIAAAKSTTLGWGASSTIATIGGNNITVTMPANPNTDTHYTTGITAGATGTTSNSATTNGNTFIKIKDNSTHRGQIKIVGSGATSVSSDANGVITISSTDNNTTYGSMSVSEGTTGTATTNRVLTAANLKGIINAHAPTKTGGGASGTWGINISGNAATSDYTTYAKVIYNPSSTLNLNDNANNNSPIYTITWDYAHSSNILNQPWSSSAATVHCFPGHYGSFQLATFYNNVDSTLIRSHYNGTWTPWRTILTNGNYNSYAPTLTGGGASGTWGISISGNAATATKLAAARTISLTGSITGSGTFDGSGNLSIATTTNHSHSYLPLSGGTMTGNISFKTANYTSTPIAIYDDGTNYGHTIVMEGGGTTYIGGGEAASALRDNINVNSTENLYLAADGNIFLYTNCQDVTKKVGIGYNTGGSLYPVSNNTGSVGTTSNKWGNMYATTFHGALDGNASTASKVKNKLTVGSKTYDGSAAVTIAASDLGLASAMLFLGTTTTAITDGAKTNPVAIGGSNKTVAAGNVVLYGSKEFVWAGSAWEELGNEGSYKIVQAAVGDPSASGTSNTFIATISQDANGKITATKKTVAVTNSAPTLSWGATSTIGTVAGTNLQVKMPANPNTWRGIQNNLTSDSTTDSLSAAQGKALKALIDGKAASSHTHNYAGSSSAGGSANSAVKLDVAAAGDSNTPVYFSGGKPVACTSLDLNTSGNAATATNADQLDGIHANGFLRYSLVSSLDANGSLVGNCFYVSSASIANSAHTNHAALLNVNGLGTPFQLQIPDSSVLYVYKRWYSGGAWSGWTKMSAGYADSAGNADKIDDYHLGEGGVPYKYVNTFNQPTAGAAWYLKISTGDWNGLNEIITLHAMGNNRHGKIIIYSGSRQTNWHGYATQYNGTCCTGIKKIISNCDNVYIRLDSGTASVVIYTTFNPTITATTDADGYTMIPTEGGLFGNKTTFDRVYGAVWNDYAEYRKSTELEPGRCVIETGDGSLIRSFGRLEPGAEIVSDTFGFAIGETDECKTPLAVSGRVLAYPAEDRESYKPGDAVCSGPNGTVSKMTRDEIREWPDRIIGTVSEIPNYETWCSGNVSVNGRIWIRIR